MLHLDIPQRGSIELHHAVFDINGTLAVDGLVVSGVAEGLHQLAEFVSIHILTAGTHGNLAEIEQTLGFPLHNINNGAEKTAYVKELGAEHVAAIGNGANDVGMLKLAAIGIAVVTAEGVSTRAVQVADMLVTSPLDALHLLLYPKRLIATLRG